MTNATNITNITSLPMLLPNKPLTLLYCLPLLLASLPLVFAGTFLTFYRTSSFKPLKDNPNPDAFTIPVKPKVKSDDNIEDGDLLAHFPFPGAVAEWDKMLMREKSRPKKKPTIVAPAPYPGVPRPTPLPKWKQVLRTWRLEGGIGGLLLGFVFGVHLVIFLTLAVAHSQPSYHLAPSAFLFLWIFTSTFITLLTGRFRTFTFFVITTGGAFALTIMTALTLSTSLKATIVILSLLSFILPIPALLSALPIKYNNPNPLAPPNQRKWSIYLGVIINVASRISTSAMGAVCMLESIASLSHPTIPGWDNSLSVFFNNSGGTASNGKMLALTIFGWILYLVGVTSDWALARFVGSSTDQQWDAYLATYARNLPDRAGHFEESPTVLQRLEKIFGGRSNDPDDEGSSIASPANRLRKVGRAGTPPAFFQHHLRGRYGNIPPPPFHPSRKFFHKSSRGQTTLLDDDFDSGSDTEVDYADSAHCREEKGHIKSFSPLDEPGQGDKQAVAFDLEKDLSDAVKAIEKGAWEPGFLAATAQSTPKDAKGYKAVNPDYIS